MNRTLLQALFHLLRQARSLEFSRPSGKTVMMRALGLLVLPLAILAILAAPSARAQSNAPIRIDADIPYEARAPWFNRGHTEVEDEPTLRSIVPQHEPGG